MVPPIVGEQQKQLQRPSLQQSQTQSLPLILSTQQDAQIQQASLKVISKNMFSPPATNTVQQQIQWPSLSSLVMVVAKLYWGDAREKVCDVVGDLKLDASVMCSRGLGANRGYCW